MEAVAGLRLQLKYRSSQPLALLELHYRRHSPNLHRLQLHLQPAAEMSIVAALVQRTDSATLR